MLAQPLPQPLPERLVTPLRQLGLVDTTASTSVMGTPLAGGVSSDIWRVESKRGTVAVKQALAELKVASRWVASTERTAFEYAWMSLAEETLGRQACHVVGYEAQSATLVLEWLDPEQYPQLKQELLAGRIVPSVGTALGHMLAAVHSRASDASVQANFQSRALFEQLRIEPYLLATAIAHPDYRTEFESAAESLRQHGETVIHGDVSPKNVLVGPNGPVLLDAECAVVGDPAFDVAFFTTHLLLKSVHLPANRDALLLTARRFLTSYIEGVRWEPPSDLDERAGMLLPTLVLARVSGRSPVEYLTRSEVETVRRTALSMLGGQPKSIRQIVDAGLGPST